MIHINLTKENTSIVIPFKSGHSMLFTTFLNLFKFMKIDYEIVHRNSSKKLDNVFIFTRNPIDRFFSGYFWLISSEPSYIPVIEKYEIYDLQSYISNYLRFINSETNLHYLPQSSFILSKLSEPFDVDLFKNYRKKYDEYHTGNYKIFRIEDISSAVKSNYGDMMSKNVGIYPTVTLLEDVKFKKFPFLEMFSDDVNLLFMSFYEMLMKYNDLNQHHKHVNYYDMVSLREYNQVFNYFQYELNWFGYEKDDEIVKKLVKNIV
jgi:hypothetical protein